MAPNDRARQNHDALFPNHVSTLATTDPELIDVFDNFAFDEILQRSTQPALVGCAERRECVARRGRLTAVTLKRLGARRAAGASVDRMNRATSSTSTPSSWLFSWLPQQRDRHCRPGHDVSCRRPD
jgi:hypothetical protein